MLKKILILLLTLNTPHILSSPSSTNADYNATILIFVAGIICTWKACKDLKKGWLGFKEVNRQIKMLNEMGVKVYKVTKNEVGFNSITTKESYKITIPSHFSYEQEQQAKEHWNLLLTNDKCFNKSFGLPLAASVILLPVGIWELWKLLA